MNKYRAIKTIYNGEQYDSKAEARYAAFLDLMKKAKGDSRVTKIERQVAYPINVTGKHICKYLADFRVTFANKEVKVYDVKGVATPEYRLKKKLVEAVYGIEIIEIKKQ